MREYELEIVEALKNGLTPEPITPFNTQVLYECLGFRCGRLGLESYIELNNPLPATVDIQYDWPFPQYITGELYNILVVRDPFNVEDVVYSVSDDHSTVTHIFSIDSLTFGQGTLMEVADFGEYIFMTNGVVMIYWDTSLSAWQVKTSIATIPMMRTVCNFKGQAMGGNVVSSWYDCDETFFCWSRIGEIDFTPSLDNEAGYRRCPYGGEVYHVRRLGDHVVGYSSEGITLISPVTSPAATFGFTEFYDVGVINKGAVAGGLKEHIFVDDNYNIVKIGSQAVGTVVKLVPQVLGYQSYMQELAGEDIIVTFDRGEGNYYIGNSTKTFLLSSNGLTEIPQHPSAVWRRDKQSYMLPDSVDTYDPLISSVAFDMDYKGQKTIATIETDAINHTDPEASVDYAHDLNNWNKGSYSPINDQGIASVIASGNFFRFKLKFDSVDSDFRIRYIKPRYKMTDLRGIRGIYAPPPRGQ